MDFFLELLSLVAENGETAVSRLRIMCILVVDSR